MTACLPVSLALYTVELLAGRVAPVPFDGSAVVEGTVRPTTTSSPDAEVRGILAARLEKAKNSNQNQQIKDRSTRLKSTSYLPVASGLRRATMLTRHRPHTLRMPGLGIYTRSGATLPITPLPSRCLICTTKARHQYCLYEISYEHTKTWLIDRKVWKNKRANKCLAEEDYS